MYLPPISLRLIRLVRGMRFRLAVAYLGLMTAMLIGIGIYVRHELDSILEQRAHDILDEEWTAFKGYLRISPTQIEWFYDRQDPDESLTVENLRRVYYLSNAKGTLTQSSETYKSMGLDSREQIQAVLNSKQPVWSIRHGEDGERFLIRAGRWTVDTPKDPFFLAIGLSLSEDEQISRVFTRQYFTYVPLIIVGIGLLGWLVAGRVLEPVNTLALTAERISSSNLSSQIPPRGANDELDHLIKSFNRMISRLAASFTQTRQFSTDVSHELRTPLTVIRGQLEVALLTAETPDQFREAIMEALQDVERLGQTIRALLLLSQAESGQLLLQKSSLDLAELVRDITEQYQIPAESAGVQLTAEVAPGECYLSGDRLQLERLLYNLLSNAVKYTPSGGSARVILECHDETAILTVADTGVGIPSSSLPHIFDRFYRVPSKDKQHPEKGLGLGLSFVSWIVKAHGGSIDVKSAPGEGTAFIVTLPREDAVPAPDTAVQETSYTEERSS